ncbi:MAG: glutamine--fructose-6-phosphate transaminase (isomerizing) [Alphaproteobacteria bacterium]|nr:glutamine--fructose-6-phosphate transaminase (isomerizing) [Alphaproteobacteria bacterium]MBU1517253.1 glutamine--fructose-6-phosphate transaminase (isomerizing) [Alphaproteobacteria bacterium]MBU2093211.1 glutamine--fructose-6-phosphate transaminase (isomerizing) [Alphaproteobacteria bacterium]MBU2153163.1 glutamine--fructose-6-phosphate transaminase (isomerizing) [Alphaproteobacteria bacterium]MBU2307869.1 glutamine--fructose-6-phosphate transaminase (isomerizing) [Alphaproteobacteria bact
MCGIVGYIGTRPVLPLLVEGLRRLEYRGYDSAGVAIAIDGVLAVYKRKGKVRELESVLPVEVPGTVGIAHTRWATHGAPSDLNAHPHLDATGRIGVVHNGIIENAAELKRKLQADGVVFVSETDTEVLAHLIAGRPETSLVEAVRAALRLVKGAYGLAVIDAARPEAIVAARKGGPVVIGVGDGEMFVASDASALMGHARSVAHLDDGEVAEVRADGFTVLTLEGAETTKTTLELSGDAAGFDKGDYAHFMRKEIGEQPEAVRRTLLGRLDHRFSTAHLGGIELAAREMLDIRRVKILGCGSAYYAGTLGAHLIEQLARIPAHAEPASEFRYRNPVIEQDTLYIAVSQSGETFDTLAAIQEVKRKGGRVLGVVNSVGSTIARECGRGVYLHAGPEVAVVSTKTWTSTAVAFALLALQLGRVRDMSAGQGARLLSALSALPDQIAGIVAREAELAPIAARLAKAEHAYFLGRAAGYAVAMEGALKLKEISYMHAEAYPASELKHGPLALISAETPTLMVLPDDDLLAKNLSTIAEVRTRGGPVLAITHPGVVTEGVEASFAVPRSEPELDAILLNVPLQLVAYQVAQGLGRDIDQPRNLAKSVTVE